MDPRLSAQDVVRCDLCKDKVVESYCEYCHVKLCKPCIGEHISDEYDKHKIVPFQERRSALIFQLVKHIRKKHANCNASHVKSSFAPNALYQKNTKIIM